MTGYKRRTERARYIRGVKNRGERAAPLFTPGAGTSRRNLSARFFGENENCAHALFHAITKLESMNRIGRIIETEKKKNKIRKRKQQK